MVYKIFDPKIFAKRLSDLSAKNPGGLYKIGGLDISSKKLGIALSDYHRINTFQLDALNLYKAAGKYHIRNDTNFARSLKILSSERRKILGWVVGLPLELSGVEGPRVAETKEILNDLLKVLNITPNILFYDERFSTVMARASFTKDIDSKAAAIILEEAMQIMYRS